MLEKVSFGRSLQLRFFQCFFVAHWNLSDCSERFDGGKELRERVQAMKANRKHSRAELRAGLCEIPQPQKAFVFCSALHNRMP